MSSTTVSSALPLQPPSAEPAASGTTVAPSRLVRWVRAAYCGIQWALAACLMVQIFLAGLGVFGDPGAFRLHTTFVHLFEALPLLALIFAFVGRLPARLKWLSGAQFLLVMAQYATASFAAAPGMEMIAALHPVTGFLMTWVAVQAAQGARRLLLPQAGWGATVTGVLLAAVLVAGFATVAGAMSGAPSAAGEPAGTASTVVAGAPNVPAAPALDVTLVGRDDMRFEPATFEARPGQPVQLTLRNEGRLPHDFTLSRGPARTAKVIAQAGQTASVTFTIPNPGVYTFVCAQPGHATAGMTGTITVLPAAFR